MKSLTKEKRYDMIAAFNSTSRYLDDLLNIDNIHFEQMVHRIYTFQESRVYFRHYAADCMPSF